ncbi:MAG: hypothetical protein JNN13_09905 [Planctomycetes bacterium]|nr:hypothetical protein [Planctomycetota bacterium]
MVPAAITCALVSACLPAQGPPLRPGGVHLRKWSGLLGLSAEYRDESSTSASGAHLAQDEWLLREIVGGRLIGDIYHPALFDFDAGLEVSFDQRTLSAGETENQESRGVSLYGDVRGEILQEKGTSGDVFGRRSRTQTRQRFFATSMADVTSWGGDVRFKEFWIPSVLHYENNSYEGHGYDRLRQNNDQWQLQGTRTTEWNTITYTLQHNNINQVSFRTHYDETFARAEYATRFGSAGDHQFHVGGYWRQQTGDLETLYEQVNTGLRLQWLESLYSQHDAALDHTEIDSALTAQPSRQDTLDLSSSLHHQLYDSLQSGVGIRKYHGEYGAGESDRLQTDFEVDYRKKVPFGVFGAYYHPSQYRQEEQSGTEAVPVLDEAHTYDLTRPLVLQFPYVVDGTIVVTDGLGTTFFGLGIDFVPMLVGGRTELLIPVGSQITDGTALLIDYVYLPSPDRTYEGLQQDVGVSYDFLDWAALNLDHATEDLTILTGPDDGTLSDTRRDSARLRVFHWDQEVSADYEDYRNRNGSYERSQLSAASRYALSDTVRISHGGRWYRTRYRELGGEDQGFSLTTSLDWHLDRSTQLYARGEYHDVTYRRDEGTGWMLEGGFDYRIRNTTLTLDIRYTSERFEFASDQDLLYAELVFRRIF